MPLLEDVKSANRITTTDVGIEKELTDLIASAKMDMVISGVSKEKTDAEEDALIKRAIILYTKANFGFDNPDTERLMRSYESLKQHLALAGDYNGTLG